VGGLGEEWERDMRAILIEHSQQLRALQVLSVSAIRNVHICSVPTNTSQEMCSALCVWPIPKNNGPLQGVVSEYIL
jgi:hypothetical protein